MRACVRVQFTRPPTTPTPALTPSQISILPLRITTTNHDALEVAKSVVEEAVGNPTAFAAELASRKNERVHVFVDNSNIFYGAQTEPDPDRPGRTVQNRSVRVSCRRTHDLVVQERTAEQRTVFGSVPRGHAAKVGNASVFKYWQDLGYDRCARLQACVGAGAFVAPPF